MSANTHEFRYSVDSDEHSTDEPIDAETLEDIKATLSGVQLTTDITDFSISITSESTPFKPSKATVEDTDEQQSEEQSPKQTTPEDIDAQPDEQTVGERADSLYECDECGDTFDSEHGRKIHQTRWCEETDTDESDEQDEKDEQDDVTVTVHGDTSRWDEDDSGLENEYLKRIDDGEDIDPEKMVDSKVQRNSGTWYVLALLSHAQGRLQSGQVHAMLEGTEWELKKGTVHEALRSLRDNGLVDDEGKTRNNGYQTTQLGRDYLKVKNMTTPGYDLLVANQITGRTDSDATQQETGA